MQEEPQGVAVRTVPSLPLRRACRGYVKYRQFIPRDGGTRVEVDAREASGASSSVSAQGQSVKQYPARLIQSLALYSDGNEGRCGSTEAIR
jgi:hypothetical protein